MQCIQPTTSYPQNTMNHLQPIQPTPYPHQFSIHTPSMHLHYHYTSQTTRSIPSSRHRVRHTPQASVLQPSTIDTPSIDQLLSQLGDELKQLDDLAQDDDVSMSVDMLASVSERMIAALSGFGGFEADDFEDRLFDMLTEGQCVRLKCTAVALGLCLALGGAQAALSSRLLVAAVSSGAMPPKAAFCTILHTLLASSWDGVKEDKQGSQQGQNNYSQAQVLDSHGSSSTNGGSNSSNNGNGNGSGGVGGGGGTSSRQDIFSGGLNFDEISAAVQEVLNLYIEVHGVDDVFVSGCIAAGMGVERMLKKGGCRGEHFIATQILQGLGQTPKEKLLGYLSSQGLQSSLNGAEHGRVSMLGVDSKGKANMEEVQAGYTHVDQLLIVASQVQLDLHTQSRIAILSAALDTYPKDTKLILALFGRYHALTYDATWHGVLQHGQCETLVTTLTSAMETMPLLCMVYFPYRLAVSLIAVDHPSVACAQGFVPLVQHSQLRHSVVGDDSNDDLKNQELVHYINVNQGLTFSGKRNTKQNVKQNKIGNKMSSAAQWPSVLLSEDGMFVHWEQGLSKFGLGEHVTKVDSPQVLHKLGYLSSEGYAISSTYFALVIAQLRPSMELGRSVPASFTLASLLLHLSFQPELPTQTTRKWSFNAMTSSYLSQEPYGLGKLAGYDAQKLGQVGQMWERYLLQLSLVATANEFLQSGDIKKGLDVCTFVHQQGLKKCGIVLNGSDAGLLCDVLVQFRHTKSESGPDWGGITTQDVDGAIVELCRAGGVAGSKVVCLARDILRYGNIKQGVKASRVTESRDFELVSTLLTLCFEQPGEAQVERIEWESMVSLLKQLAELFPPKMDASQGIVKAFSDVLDLGTVGSGRKQAPSQDQYATVRYTMDVVDLTLNALPWSGLISEIFQSACVQQESIEGVKERPMLMLVWYLYCHMRFDELGRVLKASPQPVSKVNFVKLIEVEHAYVTATNSPVLREFEQCIELVNDECHLHAFFISYLQKQLTKETNWAQRQPSNSHWEQVDPRLGTILTSSPIWLSYTLGYLATQASDDKARERAFKSLEIIVHKARVVPSCDCLSKLLDAVQTRQQYNIVAGIIFGAWKELHKRLFQPNLVVENSSSSYCQSVAAQYQVHSAFSVGVNCVDGRARFGFDPQLLIKCCKVALGQHDLAACGKGIVLLLKTQRLQGQPSAYVQAEFDRLVTEFAARLDQVQKYEVLPALLLVLYQGGLKKCSKVLSGLVQRAIFEGPDEVEKMVVDHWDGGVRDSFLEGERCVLELSKELQEFELDLATRWGEDRLESIESTQEI